MSFRGKPQWGGARPQPIRETSPIDYHPQGGMDISFEAPAPKVLCIEAVDVKGAIGKVTLSENHGWEGNKKAPKFKGELKIGDFVFELALWSREKNKRGKDDIPEVFFSGPVKRKGGHY